MNNSFCHQALTRPTLVLPLTSMLPAAPGRAATTEAVPGHIGESLCDLADRLTGDILSPTDLTGRLAAAARALGGQASRAGATLDAVPDAERSEIEGSTEYDRFFGVRRVAMLSAELMADQIAVTACAVLTELSYSVLSGDETTAILYALSDMLAWGSALSRVSRRALRDLVVPGDPASGPTEARAEYRWVIGHHFFNLASMFCLDAITTAQACATGGDDDGAAAALMSAARHLRATTAAMWFASVVPVAAYLRHIRPAMAAASGNEAGFSGTQNLDYFRMRRAVDEFRKTLGGAPAAALHKTRAAHALFTEIEIEDVEHHVLIAAAKVGGTEPSLLTSTSLAGLPAELERVPAVEVLRDLAEQRRTDRDGRR